MSTEIKTNLPVKEFNFKAKSIKLLQTAYYIAEASLTEAHKLTSKGEKAGVGGWMHVAEKAIGEIVRLRPLCGNLDNQASVDIKEEILGWKMPPKVDDEPKVDA